MTDIETQSEKATEALQKFTEEMQRYSGIDPIAINTALLTTTIMHMVKHSSGQEALFALQDIEHLLQPEVFDELSAPKIKEFAQARGMRATAKVVKGVRRWSFTEVKPPQKTHFADVGLTDTHALGWLVAIPRTDRLGREIKDVWAGETNAPTPTPPTDIASAKPKRTRKKDDETTH